MRQTIMDKLREMLVANGLFPDMADKILAEAVVGDLAPQARLWHEEVSRLGQASEMFVNLAYNQLRPVALAWIDKNIPQAWFRPMFTEDPLAEVNRLRVEGGQEPLPPPPPPPQAPTPEVNDENIALLKAIYRIQALVAEYAKKYNTDLAAATAKAQEEDPKAWLGWPTDLAATRDYGDSPNPYYNQTKSGLFIEFYYGSPQKLWTPWGEFHVWRCMSGGSEKAFRDYLTEAFGAQVYKELYRSEAGEHGPYLSLHSLDGQPLPEPAMFPKGTLRTPYDELKKSWTDVKQRAL